MHTVKQCEPFSYTPYAAWEGSNNFRGLWSQNFNMKLPLLLQCTVSPPLTLSFPSSCTVQCKVHCTAFFSFFLILLSFCV